MKVWPYPWIGVFGGQMGWNRASCPRIGDFGGQVVVMVWVCPRNRGFGGRTIVVELVLEAWEVLPV